MTNDLDNKPLDGTTLDSITLDSTTLWQQVEKVSESALACGALKSIPTHCEVRELSVGDCTVKFQIRVVENLIRKSKETQARAKQTSNDSNKSSKKAFNPFLPYEPDLYVGELTNHYRCLLNKFNVMDHHILMVTNKFVPQQTPLDVEDFLAALICLQAQEGLVFYNGGTEAGASVEHKHLQMIPLPLEKNSPFPFNSLLASTLKNRKPAISDLPFKHQILTTDFPGTASIEGLKVSAKRNYGNYHQMLKELDLSTDPDGMMAPHNMLMTRDFIWVVPRTKEQHQGLAVNALGFAGTLLVKDKDQLKALDSVGCLELLKAVAIQTE